ncbi:SURF1 family protein [Novosphingobium sp. 9U]|uniref:SURF1 family protein n=1 Tax=Novosphingobium sp. 9U TaxID=2653158 RepID=UPI0012EFBC15|nr:SURF1 family protein [Novosphingobium sp. 9U]VWX48594.1 SURF1-like protein [Novosphingobium sp. 9U]
MTGRRIPIIPTILVLAAAGVMVALGFWQLRRLHEKEALLARYQSAHTQAAEVPWPATEAAAQLSLYRHSRLLCARVIERRGIAGRSARGEAGLAVYAQCVLPDGSQAKVVMGWARDPAAQGNWNGGEVRGVIAPGPRLVADPPLGGLEANERPDPSEIPNNHLAYAGQWFFFALTALIVYAVALRRRRLS